MKIAIAIVLVATSSLSPAATRPQDRCLAGMREALIAARDFSGPLVCSKKDATFVLLGRTVGSGLSIYDYRYRFLPHPGGTMHGGQRIVIFRGKIYVGQYNLSPPSFTTVTVRGRHVVFQKEGEKVELDFSKRPPSGVYFDGQTFSFFR